MHNKAHILVVDDNIELCCNLRDILEDNLYTVEYTHNGKEAIALFEKSIFDIALVDIKLPDIDGTEVVREATKISKETDFIYITGNATLESAILATKENQVVSYETKPLDMGFLLFLLRQITERKKSQKKLEEAEIRYRTLFECSPVAVLIVNPETCLPTEFNGVMLQLVGYTSEEFIKLPISKYVTNLIPDKVESYIGIIKQKGKEIFETNMHTKHGQTKCVIANIHHIDVSGRSLLHCIFTDITERKEVEDNQRKLEAQVLRLQRLQAIGTMTSGIAHDFNNILTPIFGFVQMAMMHLEPNSKAGKNMRKVLISASRAKELVGQILTFSRGVENKPKPIFISQIINETLKLLRAAFPSTIHFKMEIDAKCGAVIADPTHIHQIVVNLCTNAKDAIGQTDGVLGVVLSSVEVTNETLNNKPKTLPNGTYALLTISDTGSGLCEETIKLIFTPFFTTKEVGKGTGLGLSIVHRIVQSYGGKVIVESQKGKGTKFHVYLPIALCDVQLEDESEKPIYKGTETILFVDDDEIISFMGNLMLSDLGYSVTSSTDSIETLKLFRENPDKYDLVITDLTMPNITGDKLAIELMRIRKDIPIIIMTGFSASFTYKNCQRLGVKGFLIKPLDIHTLSRTIRQTLDKKM